jgi:hypothetical protein
MNRMNTSEGRDGQHEAKILAFVQRNTPSTIEKVIEQFPKAGIRDSIYWLLFEFKLIARLEIQELSKEHECLLFTDIETAYAWQFSDNKQKKPLLVACLKKGAKFVLNGQV